MGNYEDIKIGSTIKILTADYEVVDIFVHYNHHTEDFITKIVLKSGSVRETWTAKQVFKYLRK